LPSFFEFFSLKFLKNFFRNFFIFAKFFIRLRTFYAAWIAFLFAILYYNMPFFHRFYGRQKPVRRVPAPVIFKNRGIFHRFSRLFRRMYTTPQYVCIISQNVDIVKCFNGKIAFSQRTTNRQNTAIFIKNSSENLSIFRQKNAEFLQTYKTPAPLIILFFNPNFTSRQSSPSYRRLR
jgi:hypothetical protein